MEEKLARLRAGEKQKNHDNCKLKPKTAPNTLTQINCGAD